ncbi:hypothetical protein [Kribbella sp. HUAS MG21]|uniref:Uncharacterized protein n=1 Tax=Kribbella sp. HUAS MG21 TaxID=3160966 RepID=A0AAU7TJH5_9ACTN
MSSLKLSNGSKVEAVSDEGWVAVRSPLRDRTMPEPTGVVLSLTSLRDRYARGEVDSVEIDVDETSYGGGDPDLAGDIERSMDERWDD